MVLHFGQFAPPHDCCRRCAVDIGGLKKKQTGTYVHFLGQIFVYSAILYMSIQYAHILNINDTEHMELHAS